jgi:hypothetical protein
LKPSEGTIKPPLTDDVGTVNRQQHEQGQKMAANDEEASQEATIYSNMSEVI